MANIKSQIKRNKQNEKAHQRNKAVKSSLRTSVRKFREAADAGNLDEAGTALRAATRAARQGGQQGRYPQEPGREPQVRDRQAVRRTPGQLGRAARLRLSRSRRRSGWRRSGGSPVPARRLRWSLRPSPARPPRRPRAARGRCRPGASRAVAAGPGRSSTAGRRPRRRARRCWQPRGADPTRPSSRTPCASALQISTGETPVASAQRSCSSDLREVSLDRAVGDGEPGRLGPAPVVPGHDGLVDDAVGVGGELVAGGRELAQIRTHRVEQRPGRAVVRSLARPAELRPDEVEPLGEPGDLRAFDHPGSGRLGRGQQLLALGAARVGQDQDHVGRRVPRDTWPARPRPPCRRSGPNGPRARSRHRTARAR